MRVDKFLWSVRVYKTRNISCEEIKKNRVSVSGNLAKSSKEVRQGDIISIRKNGIEHKIKVIQIPKNRLAASQVPLYVTDMTEKEQYELLKIQAQSQNYQRKKGEGRPTKKDRREMDAFFEIDDEN